MLLPENRSLYFQKESSSPKIHINNPEIINSREKDEKRQIPIINEYSQFLNLFKT
jgi:hypothetical protein